MSKKLLKIGICTSLVLTSVVAKDFGSLDEYLENIKINGNLRVGHLSYNYKNEQKMGIKSSYDTAIGGNVKFDLPINNNINLSISPYFSKSFGEISDDTDEEFKTLASKDNDYMMLGEANISFAYNDFSLILGRQIVNTPLLGDDDLRLTPQTFQGAFASYKYDNLVFNGGYFNRWQGYDAGLLDIGGKGFNDFEHLGTKKSDGVALFGIEYENNYDFSNVSSRLYYYDIDKFSNVFYADVNFNNKINDELSTDIAFQYSNQSENNNSGKDADLYGTMLGLAYNNLYVYAAYTQSSLDANKSLFNGFGGEFYYTATNEWAMGYLDDGLDEKAYTFGVSYDFNDRVNLTAYNGTFKNDKQKIMENDIVLSYSFNDNLMAEAMYFNVDDRKDSDYSYDIFLARVSYTF